MKGALNVNIVASGVSKMTAERLPVTSGFVLARTMDEQRMEEDNVSLFHL